MGAPAQEQMIQQPYEPPVIVVQNGDNSAVLWASGVIVPIIVAVLGVWANKKRQEFIAKRKK